MASLVIEFYAQKIFQDLLVERLGPQPRCDDKAVLVVNGVHSGGQLEEDALNLGLGRGLILTNAVSPLHIRSGFSWFWINWQLTICSSWAVHF